MRLYQPQNAKITTPHPSNADAGLLVVLNIQWASHLSIRIPVCLLTLVSDAAYAHHNSLLGYWRTILRSCAKWSYDPVCHGLDVLWTEIQSDYMYKLTYIVYFVNHFLYKSNNIEQLWYIAQIMADRIVEIVTSDVKKCYMWHFCDMWPSREGFNQGVPPRNKKSILLPHCQSQQQKYRRCGNAENKRYQDGIAIKRRQPG